MFCTLLLVASSACVSSHCREELSDCIKRCEDATPNTGEPARSAVGDVSLTECEIRCGCRGREPKREPMGEVTPTS